MKHARIVSLDDRLGISARRLIDDEVLREIERVGIKHYQAFGRSFPYPEAEAALIRRFESQKDPRANEYEYEKTETLGRVVEIRRTRRVLWLRVPEPIDDHRECESHGVVVFTNEEAAADYEAYLALKRLHSLAAAAVTAYVFDPDLFHGDFGIDTFNSAALPAKIATAVDAFEPGRFLMGNNGVVPTTFRPEDYA